MTRKYTLREITDFEISNRDKLVWQQFTGLKDKNGVEIFEGDIVRYTSQLGNHVRQFEVEWEAAIAGFTAGGAHFQRTNIYEIIGNIYESPELLEQ